MFRYIDEPQVREYLSYEALIPALRQALIDYSAGRIHQPLRPVLPLPGRDAWFSVMPAIIGSVMGAKLVSVFPKNTDRGLPSHLAVIALFSAETGELLALMDGRLITEMRTAAISAIATDALVAADASVLAILGSGVQARSHWAALRKVRDFQEVRVWSRNRSNAERFANECGGRFMSPEEAVRDADVVVTVTHSPEPILRGAWLRAGSHVNAVGAVGPKRRELDHEAVQGAFVVVESRASAMAEAGDLILAGVGADAELGEVLAGKKGNIGQRTIFKSLGIAAADLVAAELCWRRADHR